MEEIKEWKDSIEEIDGLTEERLDTIKPEEMNESLINALIATVNRLKAKVSTFDRLANEEHQKINDNRKRLVDPLMVKIEKTENLLELYMYKIYNGSNGKVKSYQGFYGTMGFRKNPDKLVIEDEETAIAELEFVLDPDDYNAIVKTKTTTSIDKRELKKLVQEHVGDGFKSIKIEPGELKFNVGE